MIDGKDNKSQRCCICWQDTEGSFSALSYGVEELYWMAFLLFLSHCAQDILLNL